MTSRFLHEHHGDIRVESECGVGTKVLMWLPAVVEGAPNAWGSDT